MCLVVVSVCVGLTSVCCHCVDVLSLGFGFVCLFTFGWFWSYCLDGLSGLCVSSGSELVLFLGFLSVVLFARFLLNMLVVIL